MSSSVYGYLRGKKPKVYKQPLKEIKCTKCNQILHFSKFRKRNQQLVNEKKVYGIPAIDGSTRLSSCLKCEYNRFKLKYINNPIPQILSNAKIRAKKKNISFNLTSKYLMQIWPKNNKCPVFDFKFVSGTESGSGFKENRSPSLDRININKGYIEGNVVIVSRLANKIKTDATIDQIKKVYDFYKNIRIS